MHLLLLLSLLIATPPDEDGRRLPPVDQCASDPQFAAFRSSLLDAIERRDPEFVLETIVDDILVDLGGGAGRAYFAEAWDLDRPGESRLWHELGEALRLGCMLGEEGHASSPTLFGASEIDDPFATFLVIRPGATMHVDADPDSAIVATLDWDLVEGIEWQEGDTWWRVRLADGREGFVRSADLRSPIDYRTIFERIDGRWRMTAFIAGD